MINLKVNKVKITPVLEDQLNRYEFSDYDADEQFEDSKEILSESELELCDDMPATSKRLLSPDSDSVQKSKGKKVKK